MPRPPKKRCCRKYQADRVYKPQGIPMTDISKTEIDLDQFEAMRLCDIDGLDQSEAGDKMGISRGTVQRLLYSGRKQLLEAILSNSAITINLQKREEDNVSMCTNQHRRRDRCGHS